MRNFDISKKASFQMLISSALQLFKSLDTPISRLAHDCVKAGDWAGYLDLYSRVKPNNYQVHEADRFACDIQAVSLFRKAESLPGMDSKNRIEACKMKFLEAEAHCARTNSNLLEKHSRFASLSGHDILGRARNHIRKVLRGVTPDAAMDLPIRLSGGSTVENKGDLISIPDKISSTVNCSPNALKYVMRVLSLRDNGRVLATVQGHHYDGNFTSVVPLKVSLTDFNVYNTVPKTALVDRPICIEPLWNLILQKQVGTSLRKCLKRRAGIDIVNAEAIHKELALEASLTGELCTIDLQSASDTVSFALVEQLLPTDWFEYLDSIRSQNTKMPDGSLLENEKFSSMGNGFTFELETLIFWAIARSVSDVLHITASPLKVYGDDIICDSKMFNTLTWALECSGFLINQDKSFHSGPFRESCGSDGFNGFPVRPYHIKEIPSSYFDLYRVLNGLRLAAHRRNMTQFGFSLCGMCDPRYKNAWVTLLKAIPKDLQFFGPEQFGDAVILTDAAAAYGKPGKCSKTIVLKKTRKRCLDRYPPHVGLTSIFMGSGMHFAPRDAHYTYKLKVKDWKGYWGNDFSFPSII